ncbi:abortive infection protein [Brevundimonas sp. AAP58]|uniref:CPBP family intramembrane glutamic endopeptidase, BDIM_20840 family n=1 Tax=Brevundimonas sp. AAP58 TaxID=1523422 RepID=UPI0006B99D9B|nr:CPBP family intramembrane glutamic endopeptidase [Brevundimonas sp. AAP58]KPF79302.1 abortive infection protein [Brevundimonas sp. AAP58]
MDGVIGTAGVVAILLGLGTVIGIVQPSAISWRWMIAAAALVVLNDVLLTSGYRTLPDFVGGDWNWQGKLLALFATLAVAALPTIGWRASGLTLRQAPGSLKAALMVSLVYGAFFLTLALVFPNETASAETIAFQLTMPGLEEEAFYRGVLLLVLGRAFTARLSLLGVEWHWGAVLSCILFGLAHALSVSDGVFAFDTLTMALTGVPSVIGVWLVLRTRSVLLPVLMHNFGNAIMLLI